MPPLPAAASEASPGAVPPDDELRPAPGPPRGEEAPPPGCANCGTPAVDAFCAHCGQEHAQARVLSLREVGAEALDTFVSFDSKVFRTLVPLLTQPGRLTRDYLEGRRAPYLSPMKLFVMLNVGYFFLVQLFFPLTAEMALGSSDAVAREAAARGLAVPAFTARFEDVLADVQPTWVFVLVPLFAMGVAALYVRGRWPVALHLAFAFHVLSFVLVAFAVVGVVEAEAITGSVLVALPVYITVALRRVYAQPWGRSVAKGGLATGWFFVLLILYYSVVTSMALGRV